METHNREMKCFLSLLLLQGIQKSVERWFWSKQQFYRLHFFVSVMSENRFALIMFLHFENSKAFEENKPETGAINRLASCCL